MGRKKETDELKVKRVYPDARCVKETAFGVTFYTIQCCGINFYINPFALENLAWADALRQINAAKKKSYYKHKISRPNNEKKGKVNIMLYPSDKTAIIGEYGSVQKFINHSVEQIKLANNENSKV